MTVQTSFTNKQLRVSFVLVGANQVFPGTGNNTLTLTGLRMSARIDQTPRLLGPLDLKIWGMKQADMNALTVAFANPPVILDHQIILEANDGNGWTQVYRGTIREAQPIYRSQPDVYFQVVGLGGYFQKINAAPPTSYPETVDIGVVAGDIIDKMSGFTYVDGGADGVLDTPYFYGTLWDQLKQACDAAKADFYIQGQNILVVNRQTVRPDAVAIPLNPQSGLVGSPEYSGAGLVVTAVYNPAFACATPLQLTTNVPAATGRWNPIQMRHSLDALVRGGQWFTNMICVRVLV